MRYAVSLGPRADRKFRETCSVLGIPWFETIRRALNLFHDAVKADHVVLVTDGAREEVEVK